MTSTPVQSILEAVRAPNSEQRQELSVALTELELPPIAVSESRRLLVESIMGKYRDVPTSSEAFIQRKR